MNKPIWFGILMCLATIILAGCGETDGTAPSTGAAPQSSFTVPSDADNNVINPTDADANPAILKLITTGPPATAFGALDMTVEFPDKVAIPPGKDQMTTSGVAPADSLFAVNYMQKATVRIALISTTPIPMGEFFTIKLSLPAGIAYTGDDFIVTGSRVCDTYGRPLPVSVTKALTFQ